MISIQIIYRKAFYFDKKYSKKTEDYKVLKSKEQDDSVKLVDETKDPAPTFRGVIQFLSLSISLSLSLSHTHSLL